MVKRMNTAPGGRSFLLKHQIVTFWSSNWSSSLSCAIAHFYLSGYLRAIAGLAGGGVACVIFSGTCLL